MVALGSALGGLARYGVSTWMTRSYGSLFPWGTLAVNVAGCFVIGVIAVLIRNPVARLFLMTGFCGGFTTMSSFGFETLRLAQSGSSGRAAAYTVASLALCLGAVWLGENTGKWLGSR